MSPAALRRFRAERVLQRDFDGLRASVLATVRSRLGTGAADFDSSDLEACYAQAWQGLYTAMLDGKEIANPSGWLVVVTLRRAIDERRARHDAARCACARVEERGSEPDLAARLDDMRRLRQVFEALRERLDRRECEAATLCYLQGLPRAEAARRMGISDRRMRKLMEGNGSARRGVAAKVGDLLAVVRADGWCAERGSLMRAFAFGVLDPAGERYRFAIVHQRECPACRRYVLSLRGLAAILPPLALPTATGAGAGAGAGLGAAAGTGSGGGAGAWPFAGSIAGKLSAGAAALGLAASGALIAAGSRSAAPPARRSDAGEGALRAAVVPSQQQRGALGAGGLAATSPVAAARPGTPGSRAVWSRARQERATTIALGEAADLEFGIEAPSVGGLFAAADAPAPARHASDARALAATRATASEPSVTLEPASVGVEHASRSPGTAVNASARLNGARRLGGSARAGGEFSFE